MFSVPCVIGIWTSSTWLYWFCFRFEQILGNEWDASIIIAYIESGQKWRSKSGVSNSGLCVKNQFIWENKENSSIFPFKSWFFLMFAGRIGHSRGPHVWDPWSKSLAHSPIFLFAIGVRLKFWVFWFLEVFIAHNNEYDVNIGIWSEENQLKLKFCHGWKWNNQF